jgi:hypothetical protein
MSFRLLAITHPGSAVSASTRYRVTAFEPYLHRHHIQVETRHWPRREAGEAERAALLDSIATADAVLLQRFLPTRAWLREIRARAQRLVYDFDDAVLFKESTRGRPHLRLPHWWRFRALMRCCDAVTAGNSYLAELALREAPHSRVGVLPTTLDLERYDREPAPETTGPVVGWIGGRWTLPYLAQLRRPLERLSTQIEGLTVRVIADQAPALGSARVELVPWAAATEVRELKRLRAGAAPLPDDAWTRGKCGLRLLQYLAAGIPRRRLTGGNPGRHRPRRRSTSGDLRRRLAASPSPRADGTDPDGGAHHPRPRARPPAVHHGVLGQPRPRALVRRGRRRRTRDPVEAALRTEQGSTGVSGRAARDPLAGAC